MKNVAKILETNLSVPWDKIVQIPFQSNSRTDLLAAHVVVVNVEPQKILRCDVFCQIAAVVVVVTAVVSELRDGLLHTEKCWAGISVYGTIEKHARKAKETSFEFECAFKCLFVFWWYRWPSLSVGLLFAVLTIRGP